MVFVRSYTQRNVKTTMKAPPTTATHQLTTMPTSTHTTPIAKPTGQIVEAGLCGLPSLALTRAALLLRHQQSLRS